MTALYEQMLGLEQYLASTDLEPGLQYLVKMRASQINGCAHCMSMHMRDGVGSGDRVDRYAVLPAWRECDWFTPRERAALAWTEALTLIATTDVTDALHAEVRAEFDERQLADLTLLIIAINGWNRIAIPFETPPDHWEV